MTVFVEDVDVEVGFYLPPIKRLVPLERKDVVGSCGELLCNAGASIFVAEGLEADGTMPGSDQGG